MSVGFWDSPKAHPCVLSCFPFENCVIDSQLTFDVEGCTSGNKLFLVLLRSVLIKLKRKKVSKLKWMTPGASFLNIDLRKLASHHWQLLHLQWKLGRVQRALQILTCEHSQNHSQLSLRNSESTRRPFTNRFWLTSARKSIRKSFKKLAPVGPSSIFVSLHASSLSRNNFLWCSIFGAHIPLHSIHIELNSDRGKGLRASQTQKASSDFFFWPQKKIAMAATNNWPFLSFLLARFSEMDLLRLKKTQHFRLRSRERSHADCLLSLTLSLSSETGMSTPNTLHSNVYPLFALLTQTLCTFNVSVQIHVQCFLDEYLKAIYWCRQRLHRRKQPTLRVQTKWM